VTGPAAGCVGQPLSWLLLERHALGDLPEPEATRVRAHLAACPVCAACAAEAAHSPPFVLTATAPTRKPWWRRYAAAWATTTALACAAAGFLLLARSPDHAKPIAAGQALAGVKGGDAARELVRARDGAIAHGADTFGPGDRWKALVTCPAGGVVFWELFVRDQSGTHYPLAPGGPISCGNHVVLPGAFRVEGSDPAQVCVRLATDLFPRPPSGRDAAPLGQSLCVSLRPER